MREMPAAAAATLADPAPLALLDAVSAIDVAAVHRLIAADPSPSLNAQRPAAEYTRRVEQKYQPDTPLKMVVFRASDCLLSAHQHAQLSEITSALLLHGADPRPALELAALRNGAYPGPDAEDVWAAWHVIAAAAAAAAAAAEEPDRAAQTVSLKKDMAAARPAVLEGIRAAQDRGLQQGSRVLPPYATALSEIAQGHKDTHWIWYIWPSLQQIRP